MLPPWLASSPTPAAASHNAQSRSAGVDAEPALVDQLDGLAQPSGPGPAPGSRRRPVAPGTGASRSGRAPAAARDRSGRHRHALRRSPSCGGSCSAAAAAPRLSGLEAVQPRQQPARCHGDVDLQGQLAGAAALAQPRRGLADPDERIAQHGEQRLARLGQLDAPALAPEQRPAPATGAPGPSPGG